MRVHFLQIAEFELDQAFRWYESQAPGLGDTFVVEMLSAAKQIADFPEAWQALDVGVRCCRLSRFPYGLIYAFDIRDRGWRYSGARSRPSAPRT